MSRNMWPLVNGRPAIEIVLTRASDGQPESRILLADSGAGTVSSSFELLMAESDCLLAGGTFARPIRLSAAYRGQYPSYLVRVKIPALGFDEEVVIGAVDSLPPGFAGLACFRFLNRFTYGNFGDPGKFGLET